MQRDIKKMTTVIKNRTGNKSAFLGDVDPCPILLTGVPKNTRKEKEHKRKLIIKTHIASRYAKSGGPRRFSTM